MLCTTESNEINDVCAFLFFPLVSPTPSGDVETQSEALNPVHCYLKAFFAFPIKTLSLIRLIDTGLLSNSFLLARAAASVS